jgi:hypothetical protein
MRTTSNDGFVTLRLQDIGTQENLQKLRWRSDIDADGHLNHGVHDLCNPHSGLAANH